jgi:aspartyl-tRNA(Asn)/glutamyl-tRNA(Gln) amidotransferase subunit A
MTGMPAIVLPCGYSSNNLPLSVQFMAPRLKEDELLKFAYIFEKATSKLRNRYKDLLNKMMM